MNIKKNIMWVFKKSQILNILFFVVTLLFISCEKVSLEPVKVDREVKFSADVQPIFDVKCVSCHIGTPKPDLQIGKAFSALEKGNYFDTITPSQSKLYLKLTTSESHKSRATESEKATILQWITLGAKND